LVVLEGMVSSCTEYWGVADVERERGRARAISMNYERLGEMDCVPLPMIAVVTTGVLERVWLVSRATKQC